MTYRDFRMVMLSPNFTVKDTCPSRVTVAPCSRAQIDTRITASCGRIRGRFGSNFAVEGHGRFERDEGKLAADVTREGFVEFLGFGFQ